MKKNIISTVLCGVVAISSVCAVSAEEPMVIAPLPSTANTVQSVVLNGKKANINASDIYKSGKLTMVPLRAVAEKLGFKVVWDEAEQGIRLDDGETNTEVYIGKDTYYMASSKAIGMSAPTALGAAPELKDDKTYVPADMFEILYCNPSAVYEKDGALYIDKDAKDSEDGVQIPNPFTSYKTLDEAKKAVVFDVKVPKNIPSGYEMQEVQTMGNDFIQVFYTKGEKEILYRMAKGSEDISGDYNNYKTTKDIKVGDLTVTVRGNENIAGAVWKSGEFTYSVMFDDEVSETELVKIISSLS